MKKEILATGRTVEEAIDNGCEQLGIVRGVDDYEHEIVDMPSKGFLGIGAKPASVRIWVEVKEEKPAPAQKIEKNSVQRVEKKPENKPEPKAEEKPEPKPEPKAEEKPEEKPAEQPTENEKPVDFGNKPDIVLRYVKSIVEGMGLEDVTVSVDTDCQNIKVQIDGDNAGITIGRRGETLDAIQYLAGLAANRGEGDFAHVVVNSGTYRAKRRHTLEQLAKRLAQNAVRTGRSTTLEPMNPYERRIIHSAVAQVEGATSSSIGEEPNRCVVVSSLNPRPGRGEGERRQRGNKGDRNDRNFRGGRDRRDNRGRRPKPEPYHESGVREVAPAEAQNHSLYGKVEI